MKMNGVVDSIGTRNANTKFGARTTYSIKIAGQDYALGFAKPSFSNGTTVEFDYESTKYGNEVTKGTLVVIGAMVTAGIAPIPPLVIATPAPVRATYSDRKFPIDALSPERAIIRQNALTQARELVVGILGVTASSDKDWTSRQNQFNTIAGEVIRLARKFEAYSSGDLDIAEVKNELAAEKKVA